MEPKKEQKYLVVKQADITDFFEKSGIHKRYKISFELALGGIQAMRRKLGKKDNKYIVVNQDEPYAEQVWQLVLEGERQKRIHKQNSIAMGEVLG
jgi:lipase chaperone LimK